ncbi:MarR family transcriptional regulator [Paenalcaligenes hominis]|uniref:MarR family transcriptional regulator n=1 Tax=Paenalcaligenes hominis TaxID=643674 RepID=A0A1U9K134_9BURK|nr:MarR family transcriptional regulator [Paenalcaligenes hominis]GGE56571.1 transcriptional regulator [Paenalcaligenes hominis]
MRVNTEAIFVDNYLPALLAQASQIISTEFHQVVQKNGLSITEWRVLSILSGAGVVSVGQLARIATSKQPTVTRVVDKMVNAGYVHRVAHNGDRRVSLVEITEPGRVLISGLIEQAKKHESEVIERLQPLDVEALKATLRRLILENRVDE